jgi:amino acid exporter
MTRSNDAQSRVKSFVQGLMTGLTNAQTIFFFASIFAVTLSAETPVWARVLAWLGIVSASVVWRVFLSLSFSQDRVRAFYRRAQRTFECFAGLILAGFGVKLILSGVR